VTQHELARLTGCTQATIARSELNTHVHTVKLQTIFKIAEAYTMAPRTLLLGVEVNDAPALIDGGGGEAKRYWE
tara:strand:- start:43 stop:264 length:222 start_codon:yes stop_codon:yes gene_type:complete